MRVVTASDTVARLRADFDASFGLPYREAGSAGASLVVLRVASLQVGVWLSDLRSLHKGASVVRLPGEASAFVGVANLDGHLTSVFDLAALLDESCREVRAVEHTWLARLQKPNVALTFDTLLRQIVVPRTGAPLPTDASSAARGPMATGMHVTGVGTLRLLDVALLARALEGGSNPQAGELP